MATSTDPDHFFQTEAAQTNAARKQRKAHNDAGSPIRLKSKLLAVLPDTSHAGAVFVAESAGPVRRLDLRRVRAKHAPDAAREYRGPVAPSTSLALDAAGATLYAGSWDRSVWSWDAASGAGGRRFTGPADFVKCVACAQLGGRSVLVAGGADAGITVWEAASGQVLHVVRGHSRGVLGLAVQQLPSEAFVLWSAGSDRSILRHRVGVQAVAPVPFAQGLAGANAAEDDDVEQALLVHETSVNSIALYSAYGDDDGRDTASPILLTASSDKTATLTRPATLNTTTTSSDTQEGGDAWKAAQTMAHPDFVRAIVAFPSRGNALDSGFLIATACRDEEVRIWDGEDAGASAEPLFTLSGHFDEVSGLALATVEGDEAVLVSVGLDGTLRTWPASRDGLERRAREERAREAREAAGVDGGDGGLVSDAARSLLTEDEERELAELMSDDEDG